MAEEKAGPEEKPARAGRRIEADEAGERGIRGRGDNEMAVRNEPPAESNADLAEQVKALQKDLAHITETLKTIGSSQMENVSETIRGAVNQAGETVRQTAAEARHRGEVAAGEVEAAIHRNPFTAVLIALGLGFIVGSMKRR